MRNLESNLKNQFSLLLIILLPLFSTAQKSTSNFFTEAALGASIPVGKFANKTYNGAYLSNTDGLAKIGLAANLSIGYHFKKNYGAMLLLGYSQNKQDDKSFDVYLKNTYGSNTSTAIKTNNWNVFKMMAGGFFAAPFSPASKFSFQIKVLAGVFKTSIPAFNYAYSTPGNPFPAVGNLFFAKVSLPLAFCYEVRAGIKYQLIQKVYLVSAIGYFGASTNYKYLYNPNFPTPGNLISGEKKISLSSVQLTAGAGINF